MRPAATWACAGPLRRYQVCVCVWGGGGKSGPLVIDLLLHPSRVSAASGAGVVVLFSFFICIHTSPGTTALQTGFDIPISTAKSHRRTVSATPNTTAWKGTLSAAPAGVHTHICVCVCIYSIQKYIHICKLWKVIVKYLIMRSIEVYNQRHMCTYIVCLYIFMCAYGPTGLSAAHDSVSIWRPFHCIQTKGTF